MQRDPIFAELERRGAHLEGAMIFADPSWLEGPDGDRLAMDAQPALTTTANSAIPAWLTTIVDPKIYEVLFAPNMGAQILGEVLHGTWLSETAMFPYTESTGEVSSYGDYSNNGSAGVNMNFPQRQAYLYQTILQYGEREQERAGLARIAWAAAQQKSAVVVLNKYQNLIYHYGVSGLANYGLLNEPALSAALTPAPKANGGNQWIKNGAPNATANEVYNDVLSTYIQLVNQNQGNIQEDTKLVLVLGPGVMPALKFTNTFGINVGQLLKENFKNLRIESDPLYGVATTSNPQGNATGNLLQLFAESVDGQETGYCAFNEKLRSHKIVIELSSFKQKLTQGTWGFILRYPAGVAQMVGI